MKIFGWTVPFSWLPASWGLKGKSRERAEAEYLYEGYDLDKRLAEIDHRSDPITLKIELLKVDKVHGKISPDDYDRMLLDLTEPDETKRKIMEIELDFKNGKISEIEKDKQLANINGEPWVSMPKIHWDPLGKGRTYFQLDFNEHFLTLLRESGYEGDEDVIINRWLNDICISISEDISGLDGELVTPSRRELPPSDL